MGLVNFSTDKIESPCSFLIGGVVREDGAETAGDDDEGAEVALAGAILYKEGFSCTLARTARCSWLSSPSARLAVVLGPLVDTGPS